MKRTQTIAGHLGMDPEEKLTSNGTKYVTFRLANHVYNDPEGVTYWYTVTVWNPALQKWCMGLKKGSYVEVEGDYSDRVYVSNKTNKPEIGRDITAYVVRFITPLRREDDAQTAQTAPVGTPAEAPTVNESESAPKKAKAKPKAEPVAEPTESAQPDDDLPF